MKTTTILAVALMLCGASSAPALATIIAIHSGDLDPAVDEGWTPVGGGVAVTVGPVASDVGGFAGWQIDDPATALFSAWWYRFDVDAGDAAQADTDGWVFSVRVRSLYAPDPADHGIYLDYFDGTRNWRLLIGSEADGDAIVQVFGSGSYISDGSGSVHHLYEVRYDPLAASADLFVDGIERISDLGGVPNSPGAAFVGFGAGASGEWGNGVYNLVQLQLVPEPSSIALTALGLVAIGGCAWRRRKV